MNMFSDPLGKTPERSSVLTLDHKVIAQASPTRTSSYDRYSWSPFALGALAFVGPNGRLFVADVRSRRVQVPNTPRAMAPAWSGAGRRIAYLVEERRGYAIKAVEVLHVDQPS